MGASSSECARAGAAADRGNCAYSGEAYPAVPDGLQSRAHADIAKDLVQGVQLMEVLGRDAPHETVPQCRRVDLDLTPIGLTSLAQNETRGFGTRSTRATTPCGRALQSIGQFANEDPPPFRIGPRLQQHLVLQRCHSFGLANLFR